MGITINFVNFFRDWVVFFALIGFPDLTNKWLPSGKLT